MYGTAGQNTGCPRRHIEALKANKDCVSITTEQKLMYSPERMQSDDPTKKRQLLVSRVCPTL